MMDLNSRHWVVLYLFFGAVFFFMGLGGYWLKTNGDPSLTVARMPVVHGKSNIQRNLMAESDEYLAKVLTRFNSSLANVSKYKPGIDYSGKTNEAVPVWTNINPVKLVFCFPVGSDFGAAGPLIARFHKNLKTGFDGVQEIPIKTAESWKETIGKIMKREQPRFLIGINVTHPGLTYPGFAYLTRSNSRKAGVNVHLYFAADEQWQPILLPRITAGFSSNPGPFTLMKRNLNGRDIYELLWAEEAGEGLAGLEQNLEFIIKSLREVFKRGAVKKI